MGYYYSLLEWFHPLYNTENIEEYTREHLIPQMKELVCRYHPDILWTDGEWDHPSGTWHSEEFLQWLYNDSPVRDRIAVNDRWGSDTRSRHGGNLLLNIGPTADGRIPLLMQERLKDMGDWLSVTGCSALQVGLDFQIVHRNGRGC